jgi:hypothetical protein
MLWSARLDGALVPSMEPLAPRGETTHAPDSRYVEYLASIDRHARRVLEASFNRRRPAAKTSVSGEAGTHPAILSGGKEHLMSIARELARRPRIMFYHELTWALNAGLGREGLRVMKHPAAKGMTTAGDPRDGVRWRGGKPRDLCGLGAMVEQRVSRTSSAALARNIPRASST